MIVDVIQQAELNQDLVKKLYKATTIATYKKGELLLNQGEICKHLFFVETGFLRMYYYDAKGNDITHWFAVEASLLGAPESFFERKNSNYLIEAMEDSKVRQIELPTLNKLCAQHHEIEHFGRLLTLKLLMELNDKMMNLQFKTAKERYLDMIERHPDIFKRANLGHIASYIGITKQSLSRIRSEVSNI